MYKIQRLIFAFIAACAISFSAGYLSHKQTPTVTTTTTQTTDVEQHATVAIVDKTVTEEVVTKSDGTVSRTIIRNDIAEGQVIDAKVKQHTANKNTIEGNVLPKWSLGVQQVFENATFEKTQNLQVTMGYRVIGPFWAEAAFNPNNHDTVIGIRFER